MDDMIKKLFRHSFILIVLLLGALFWYLCGVYAERTRVPEPVTEAETRRPRSTSAETAPEILPTEPETDPLVISYFVTNGILNLRETPGGGTKIVYTAKEGERLVLTGNEQLSSGGTRWLEVIIPGLPDTGWVNARFGRTEEVVYPK